MPLHKFIVCLHLECSSGLCISKNDALELEKVEKDNQMYGTVLYEQWHGRLELEKG